MIKAGLTTANGERLIIAGLEEENVARLKANYPIDVPLTSFGLDIPGRLVILYGRTGEEIIHMIKTAGGDTKKLERDPTAQAHVDLRVNEPKVLIATVGIPYAGKSTWARTQAYPIVCPDEIRTALHGHRYIAEAEPFVWAIARIMVRALFNAGHQFVILDACNTTRKRRNEWQSPEWALRLKFFLSHPDDCKERALAADDQNIVPIIDRMAAKFEVLGEDELLFQ